MNTTINSLSTPIRVAAYKAGLKIITRRPCFQENRYRIKIPMGWIAVVDDFTRNLSTLRQSHPEMQDLTVYRISQTSAGQLHAEFNFAEHRSLTGILRKAKIRSEHTCQCCGAPGRRYRLSDSKRSWCPTCAAPALLLADIERLDERLQQDFGRPTFEVRHMPAGLRESFHAWVARQEQRPPGVRETVGAWHAREWRSALRPFEAALKKLQFDGHVQIEEL